MHIKSFIFFNIICWRCFFLDLTHAVYIVCDKMCFYFVGIPTAKPVDLRMHVLVMELIGEGGVAAPRLKDVELSYEQSLTAYRQLAHVLWKLYTKCRLVHADFSEYNILYLKVWDIPMVALVS